MADNLVLCVFSAGLGRAMAGNDVRIPALDQVERGDGMLANCLLVGFAEIRIASLTIILVRISVNSSGAVSSSKRLRSAVVRSSTNAAITSSSLPGSPASRALYLKMELARSHVEADIGSVGIIAAVAVIVTLLRPGVLRREVEARRAPVPPSAGEAWRRKSWPPSSDRRRNHALLRPIESAARIASSWSSVENRALTAAPPRSRRHACWRCN